MNEYEIRILMKEEKPGSDPTVGLRVSLLNVVGVKPHCFGCLHNVHVRKPTGRDWVDELGKDLMPLDR